MTAEENEILKDTYFFLRDHNPPPNGTPGSLPFWEKTAKDMSDLVSGKWDNHPLAMELLKAVYCYLAIKAGDAP